MKIIHCADLHLESSMKFLSEEKSKERRTELINTFFRMADYAKKEGVRAIIIAGDLFDKNKIPPSSIQQVRDIILKYPDINFYYLRGNHDAGNLMGRSGLIPNLRLFESGWTSYEENEVVITGAEMSGGHGKLCTSLKLDSTRTNIVVLHGQVVTTSPKLPEDIDIRKLTDKGIDYLALGHNHTYREEKLDSRGRWCYSGCLEGRGFDECGDKGFVLLNTENGTIKSSFVPFAYRQIIELKIDVTGYTGTAEIIMAVKNKGIDSKKLVKIILNGYIDLDTEINLNLMRIGLENDFYCLEITDKTKSKIDYDSFKGNASLKGEFVRVVKARDDLTDEEKALVIRYGFRALSGEEVKQ